jgi:hypothetical protein
MKKPLVVHTKQMEEEFRVKTLEGDYKLGKPGDFLMKGIEGELYICDKDIFIKSYDFVEEVNETLCLEIKSHQKSK